MAVCATSPSAAEVAALLRAPGLLDRTLTLRAPAPEDRAALLGSALQAKAAAFDLAAVQVLCSLLSPCTLSSWQNLSQYAPSTMICRAEGAIEEFCDAECGAK